MPPLDEDPAGALVVLYLTVIELAVGNINVLEYILQLDDIASPKRAVKIIVEEVPQCPDAITLPGAFGRWCEDETIVWIISPGSEHGFLIEAKTTVQFCPDIARCS